MFLLLFPLLAAEPAQPVIPEPGLDKVLTGGLTSHDFFARRAEDIDCRYELDKAKKDGAPRPVLLKWMARCGECAVRPQGEPIVIKKVTHTEVWYVSDGSCQLDTGKSFEKLSQSLLDMRQYPKKTGGFHALLEFIGYDGTTKKPIEIATESPFEAFVAISGPVFLGIPTAASYYIKNEFKKDENYFHLKFSATPPPPGYTYPTLSVPQMRLSRVLGSWYVDRDGYIRYFTAADFGLKMQYAADLASEIILDTLVQLTERAQEKP